MRGFVKAGLAAMFAATMAGAANAATITYSTNVPLQDVELGETVSVAQFNPAFGTLTGISWEITGAIASILGVENNGQSAITGSAFVSVDFNLESAVLSLAASPDFNVFGTTGPVTLAAGERVLFPIVASTTITGMEAVAAAFIGNSLVDVLVFTITSFGGSGFGGDITISQATDAGLEFSITYEYADMAPIPIPAAAPLMVAGLGALGLLGARRRKSA